MMLVDFGKNSQNDLGQDDWLVVFTSDHGESLGEHNFYYDHGDYVYNATLKVPLGFIMPGNENLAKSRVKNNGFSR